MNFMTLLGLIFLLAPAYAYEARITKGQLSPELEILLEKASGESGIEFKSSDFLLIEERNLATSKFTMYVQSNSMVPVNDGRQNLE